MTSPRPASLTIDIGALSWCWSRLGSQGEGILSYAGTRGRVSLAVPYAVADQQVTIALARFNDTGWLAIGAESSLQISGLTPDRMRWVVRVTGRAQRVQRGEPGEPAGLTRSRDLHPSHRVGDGAVAVMDRLLLVTPRVRGFYETELVADAAAGQTTLHSDEQGRLP